MEKQEIVREIDEITYDVVSKIRFVSEIFRGLAKAEDNMSSVFDGGETICNEVADRACEITGLTTELETTKEDRENRAAVEKQKNPRLLEAFIECQINKIDPARVLWDKVKEVRGIKEGG